MALGSTGAKIVRFINFILAVVGLLIIAGAMYVYFFDWGPVDRNYIEAPCVFVSCFGATAFLTSFLGHQGIYYRRKRGTAVNLLKSTSCTERALASCSSFRIFSLYITLLVLMIACEVWGLIYTLGVVSRFKSSKGSLSLDFSSDEMYLSTLFNGVFFSNQYGLCNAVSGTLFWNFIASYCPMNIQESFCRECAVYGTGSCPADQNTCFSSEQQLSFACPYILCREGVLGYAITRLGYATTPPL